ncbi:hypothetical protein ACET3Z_002026 [Daucus carota]
MPAWKEENLRAFTDRFGKWINWSYQSDSLGDFFNPLICIDLFDHKQIREEMIILYKGKQAKIEFKEITDDNDKEDQTGSEAEHIPLNQALVKVSSGDASVLSDRIENPEESSNRDQSNLFEAFRHNSDSSEICTDGSHRQDDHSRSEIGPVPENASSQSTLCSGIVRKLKVKSNRGRPRKKTITHRNPFDIGGSFKLRKRGRGKGKASQKLKKKHSEEKYLQVVPTNLVGSTVRQALKF